METCWLPDTVAQKHGGPNISVEAQVYGQVFLGRFWQVFLGFLEFVCCVRSLRVIPGTAELNLDPNTQYF